MKKIIILVFVVFFIIPLSTYAQELTYSEFNSEDNRDINFEILGKVNNNYIIYKSIKSRNILALYDNEMHIKNSVKLGFIPDRTFNIDFITYPDYFYMIYQYEKNNIVRCMAVKIGSDGATLNEPVQLDSTKIPILADNKIYKLVYSQDKQKILIYKTPKRNQIITIVTKLYDKNLKMLDSTRTFTAFDDRKEVYGDMLVDNEGNIVLPRETKGIFKDNIDRLEVIFRKPLQSDYKTIRIELKDKFIDEANIRIDNLNKRYILNSFYYNEQRGNIKGLFSVLLDADKADTIKSVFNIFPDSVRSHINSEGRYKAAFDNFFIRQAVVKKDGGFILTSEDFYSESRSNPTSWNRSNYLYSSPYTSSYDFFLANGYNNYYRPQSSFSSWQNIRYYYQNLLVMSFDNNLKIQWNTIIPKQQSDDDNDNFLSFSTINIGSEIHFLYSEDNRNRQIVSNESILPDGQPKRYPTLKSREAGYEFMPRLAKQVGYREVIIPCIIRNNIAFAKVVFFE